MPELPSQPQVPDDMEIAPGYRVRDWKALSSRLEQGCDDAWGRAVAILDARLRRRFIDAADVLIAHEIGHARGTLGFAILAIDCLLIETLQGFREGRTDHNGKSKDLIRAYLSERGEFKGYFAQGTRATDFYKHFRCALLHSGQTDGDLRLRRSGPMVTYPSVGRMDINRTAFHDAVKREYERYLDELRSDLHPALRTNFRKKMDAICGVTRSPGQGSTA